MKKVTLLFLSAVCMLQIQAQVVFNDMALGVCECLKAKNFYENAEEKNLEVELGLCLLEQVNIHKTRLKKAGYNIENPDVYKKIGERVGVALAYSCPEFVSYLTQNMQEEKSELSVKDQEQSNTKNEPAILEMNGIVHTVEFGDFVQITLRGEDGRKKEFYWIRPFEGDDILIKETDLSNKLNNQHVKIKYTEEEVFFHKVKAYLKINIIHSLMVK
jgi:hypothetical protein